MATKILNLDEIETGSEKAFILGGETHVMKPLSVLEFIAQTKRLEEMRASDPSPEASLEFMVDSICKAFPTVKREDVYGLDMSRIQMLTAHINDELEAEAEEGNAS